MLGVIAIVFGVLLGLLFFVPFVAISYRRRGTFTAGRLVLWGAALIYFLAIWTYTLLPLPDPDAIVCVGTNTDILQFVDDVQGAVARPGNTLTDPAVLQLLLNVMLFVPLGFFLRVLGGRGIIIAFFVGLGISVFIETTQVTGVWGLYPCAYRVFDVDDMLTNTTGAVLGSLLSLVVPKRLRGSGRRDDADEPRPVTRVRRTVAVVCDLLTAGILTLVASVATQLWLQYVIGDRQAVLDGTTARFVGTLAPLVLFTILVLATGRTVGDIAVELRWSGGALPEFARRVLRLIGGIGGWMLLLTIPGLFTTIAIVVFFIASVVLLLVYGDGRGLPGVLSGQRPRDAREPADAPEPAGAQVPSPAPKD